MNKALIFGARMRAKATKVVELEETIEELNKRSVVELEKLDRAKNDEEVSAVEKTVDGLQREIEEKEAEKVQLENEIDELDKQIKEQNRKAPTYPSQEKRGGQKLEQRDAIAKYIRTGQTRDIVGLKTTDSGSAALIPTEVLKPHFVNKTRNPLLDLVERVKVNSGSGKYPVIKKTDGVMVSTDELKSNPELGKPAISEIDYSIKTYRGYVPVSQEMIDDADYDIMSIVEDEVFNQGENTELSLVTAVLKTATQADAAGFDGIKDIYNKKLKSIYKASIVVTKSMFAALDKVKDKDGRYMLQTDVASPTGYSFGGKTIYKVDDTVFGNEGDMKFFIGDVTEFVKEFDRSQVSVKWVNNDIYGQLLGLFIRLDIKKADEEAGFFGTYTDVVA
ncbi:TPA: phage major capsid protein [Streptococcus pneumoniae]|uniref:Major capsid protein n=9 Tax=root TaxID=1 RepID=A0A1S5S967_9CAUD|nr:phage major capsid protein [Streptococcus pneumoniae]YP_009324860.1 major head protein [Streptococcus phage phiARI0131-2]APD22057.1 major capsid protein [Streptococcus phage IPP17]ALA47293.1 capsid domain protein [Streptococcus phage phiARI0131-2]APJ29405.1 phage major capsid protein, HK97 family [Streptococcus pneumoniae]KDA40069.1 capsid protein [Streptococcus pneumoniae]KXW03069.1 capsid protein [Streptococcus pneumoniae]